MAGTSRATSASSGSPLGGSIAPRMAAICSLPASIGPPGLGQGDRKGPHERRSHDLSPPVLEKSLLKVMRPAHLLDPHAVNAARHASRGVASSVSATPLDPRLTGTGSEAAWRWRRGRAQEIDAAAAEPALRPGVPVAPDVEVPPGQGGRYVDASPPRGIPGGVYRLTGGAAASWKACRP